LPRLPTTPSPLEAIVATAAWWHFKLAAGSRGADRARSGCVHVDTVFTACLALASAIPRVAVTILGSIILEVGNLIAREILFPEPKTWVISPTPKVLWTMRSPTVQFCDSLIETRSASHDCLDSAFVTQLPDRNTTCRLLEVNNSSGIC